MLQLTFWQSSLLLFWVPLTCEGVIYQEQLNIEDLQSLFGDEDCIEGSLSVTEDGDPVIKSSGYVSTVQPILYTSKTKNDNDTLIGKSPMSLLYELAEFNQVKVQFTLIDEKGPAHKKQFVISLKLGGEEFIGEGPSIKKAQHEVSKLALNSTYYEHPPKRDKINAVVKNNKSSVEKLDSWARKHNDALVTYSYFEQSQLADKGLHKNYYHSGMYSKAENIYKAKVKVANQVFIGEGFSLELAKQNAANHALESLQTTDGFCMLSSKEKSFFKNLIDFDSGSDSPISLVHEFGTISNMPVSFDLYSEEGLAHIKKFTFRCNIGEFESFGEGSSKKSAKKEAAVNMIHELKKHTSMNRINCDETQKLRKQKKKRSKNLIKAVSISYSEEDQDEINRADHIPEELDPVSKLFQIQQAKHEALPVFTPLEKSNNKFSIEVRVNDLTAIGTGPNKKSAKKNAALAILENMGYSATHKKDQTFSQKKKTDFSKVRGLSKKKNIVPGINLNSNKIHDIKKEPTSSNTHSNTDKSHDLKDKLHHEKKPQSKPRDSNDRKSELPKKSSPRPKSQLLNFSQQMGFKYQFSDFSKEDSSGFVSIVSLTTDPPKVCYGVGETSDLAQDRAAVSALGSLYKAQLDNLARILQEDNTALPQKREIDFIEEDHIVRSGIDVGTD